MATQNIHIYIALVFGKIILFEKKSGDKGPMALLGSKNLGHPPAMNHNIISYYIYYIMISLLSKMLE